MVAELTMSHLDRLLERDAVKRLLRCEATTYHYGYPRPCHRQSLETVGRRRYCWEHAREALDTAPTVPGRGY